MSYQRTLSHHLKHQAFSFVAASVRLLSVLARVKPGETGGQVF
jgi:hypothetical protein